MSARVSRVMMFFFLVLFCGKGHGPLVLSMLVRTGGKKALCASPPPPLASLPHEQSFRECRFQCLPLPLAAQRNIAMNQTNRRLSALLTQVQSVKGTASRVRAPNPHPPPRFKPRPASAAFSRVAFAKMRIRAVKGGHVDP